MKGKELAIRDELRALVKETGDHHKHCEAARAAVANAQQLAMFHAWQAGIRLNRMKALIGHGNWQEWVAANVRGISERTVRLYCKIDNDNPELRDVKPNRQRVADLKFDTIRKYAIGFVPEKEQPQHAGNAKFPRLVSFLNIANEYARLKQRHIDGLQRIDFDEAREETIELYQFLRWLHGDARANPWKSTAPPGR
jgi:hypothetical protein